ncbi:synaptic vesicle glycoprotein 2C-like [Galleria mellonella]|uniref:Synaptic vesicle glycoprotein 2C-like n=1 Tax=Galleria mellonella TaxID=7137 RepID=A0ABM3N3J8_GALME|nr:synaptic vesicle glycoprotein 2C-like [Galleria mellonella]XP_052758146.1 synaptic vesicle glycoprotein 2C-like [Galleria mellonella]XP_052758147.1 synaptic vesicle glycoprotein 2C-like [Galleria mellonella]XP_052758148.1 synaptic vesicle glycoprotein 2C-like [Galleria mellonella]XP_052758149.1 synaptic vesicle glycoprotein 2C-like [Galleria mellonella]XP_052758150.1 synaptic vesicle glycoprotein 2C-like [Galleria mellonella]XP_052758151.1 synaptic vesicle glycoprotein 2C-like [Galleria me
MEYEKSMDGKKRELFFEDAFEVAGHGKFNHLVLFTSGLILLNVSMESLGMSYVITAAECDLQLTNEHKGLVNAAAFIGIISTSFLWGYLGDKLGRRTVMLPALVLSAVFSIASSFSTSVWMLVVLRFLTGCLVSASSATVYAYLGEMHTNTRRASSIAWGSIFISLSFIILPGLAWLIIPGKWSFFLGSIMIVPWRAFVWAWCAPGLMAAIALLFLPESPRYLLAAKGPDAAMSVLAKMYAWNRGASVDNFPVEKILTMSVESQKTGFVGALKNISLMFRPPLLRCVLISHISMFAVFMLSSGLYVWVPEILNNILQSTSERSITICEIIHEKIRKERELTLQVNSTCTTDVSVGVFPISMGMGLVFALTYFAIGLFINKIGRQILYCGIMVCCGVATAGAALVPQGGAATALLVAALCSGCAASILAAIAVDVFPTCLRAMAMCVMYMVGRTGAAVGSYVLGATLNTYCLTVFIALGAFTAGSTLLILFWPKPEEVREKMEEQGLTY